MKEEIAKEILAESIANYDKIAKDFSNTRTMFWEELNFIKGLIKENDKILDLGCGNGRFFEQLADKNIHYTGSDTSLELLKIARERYGTKATFIKTEGINLPFDDNLFDTIFSFAVLHHIPSAKLREQFIKEARRVLKNDGILVISVWNLWQKKFIPLIIKYAFLKIFDLSKLDFKDIYLNFNKYRKSRFLHAFTKKDLCRLLEKNDFKIKRIEEIKRKSGYSNFIAIARKI
ncbi:MAG: class I SAM-dependent methyltransferase [Parcubacteria group bacterium]|nr:class I SAM-dependent methyltransferase [Parcubacteria group bacterium]MCR4342506.1 class I SAM-dependent methyltransferase [Patescibacteria group bacterium]